MRSCHYLSILVIISLLAFDFSFAQLIGPLNGTLGPGNYTVIGDISVQNGDSLIIVPGTILLFNGDYDFDIYGYFYAVGTLSDSIKFMKNTSAPGWGGLDFYASSSSSNLISYCLVSGSVSSGIDCFSSTQPTFTNCTIADNSGFMGGGICLNNADPLIQNCLIHNNSSTYYGGGASCYDSAPIFDDCIFQDNMVNNNSTTAYGGGIYCSDSQPTITGCTFESNLAGNNANGVGGGIYFTYSDPIINTCFFIDNSAGNINFGDGGGINCLESNLIVQNCIFEGNNAQGFGGGIFCDLNCELIITNCNFSNNTADLDGGGMRCYSSQVSLSHCLINSNTSGVCGGGIKSNNSNLDIHNCTLSGNGANNSGGGIYCDSIEIKNTIIEGNSGNGGIFFESNLNSEVHHNDFFNNQNGNFSGNPPANLGQIVTVNANGDSCDTHFNIFLDPLYYSLTGDSAYYLTANSPCIDAGDPGTPYDPDGTIADLGAFYFDQGTTSPLTVGLIPLNPPIQIPPGGGEFQFNISIGNSGTIPITFDAWTNVTLPDGNLYPLLMRPNLNLLPGGSLSRTVLQSVPAGAPTGIYSYNAYVGTYPTIIADSSSFPFQKLPE